LIKWNIDKIKFLYTLYSFLTRYSACFWRTVFFSLQSRWKADGPVAAALNDSIILSAAAIKVVALIIILARIQARFAIFQFCSSSKLSSPLLSGPTRKRQNGGTFRGEKRVRIIRRTCGQKNSHHNRMCSS